MCFGAEAAPYRVELYPAYHADAARGAGRARLAVRAGAGLFFDAFGWAVVDSRRLEADDLLGSLAAVEADAGGRALIMTGDRDMYQCVGDACQRPVPEVREAASRRSTRPRSSAGTGSRRSSCPTSSRCAAIRRTGCRARRGSGRRRRPSCWQRTGRWRGRSPALPTERPRVAAALTEHGRRAAGVPGHRDAADGRRRPAGGSGDRPGRWRGGGAGVRAAAPRRAARGRRDA